MAYLYSVTSRVYFAFRKVTQSGIITTVSTTPSNLIQAPADVFVDTTGNIYVADETHNVVRVIAKTTGILSIVAGSSFSLGSYSGDGSAATSARLNNPVCVAVDPTGNIYIADLGNSVVRMVTKATGIINTFAGNQQLTSSSGDGGAATSAGINQPNYVALDNTNGFLYITEANGCKVRRVSLSTKIISTVAGTGSPGSSGNGGPATQAKLGNYLQGVKTDGSGNLYIADRSNSIIWCLQYTTNNIYIIAGTAGTSGTTGTMKDETSNMEWIACPLSTNTYRPPPLLSSKIIFLVFFCPYFSPSFHSCYYDCIGDGGPATSALFVSPSFLAVDSINGNLYVSDPGNNRVRRIDITGITGLAPTPEPTAFPTFGPTPLPSIEPSGGPSRIPTTAIPTFMPTPAPTPKPTTPSSRPTGLPSRQPSSSPTNPTSQPSGRPSRQPSCVPSDSPSTQPSTQPSASPSCVHGHVGHGQIITDLGCRPCEAGYRPEDLGGTVCVACPTTTYQPIVGGWECLTCKYPSTSYFPGQNNCVGFCLCLATGPLAAVMSTLVFIFAIGLATVTREKFLPLFANVFFPSLDFFSDIAYIVTNVFYSPFFFGLTVLFVAFPIPIFMWEVFFVEEAFPQLFPYFNDMWFLRIVQNEIPRKPDESDDAYFLKERYKGDKIYYPSYRGERRLFPFFSLEKHDDLTYVLMEIIAWFLAIVLQTVVFILWLLAIIVYDIVFLPFWFFLGVVLHATKVIAIGTVWNLWFQVWVGNKGHDTHVEIDTYQLNACLFHEFFYESFPQLIIQSINNTLTKQWNPSGIFSICLTVYMTTNGCWRFLYLRYLQIGEAVSFSEIPITMTIDLSYFGLGKVVDFEVQSDTKQGKRLTDFEIVMRLCDRLNNWFCYHRRAKIYVDDSDLEAQLDGNLTKIPWEDIDIEERDAKIGQGNFGIVYKGMWKKTIPPTPVAIKFMCRTFVEVANRNYETERSRARKEATINLLATQNDQVSRDDVTVVFGFCDGRLPMKLTRPFDVRSDNKEEAFGIVFRLEGSALDECLENLSYPINTTEKVRLLMRISRGIARLHAAGIVHGDLKPANVLLSEHEPPEVRIADFGLSDVRERDSTGGTSILITTHQQGTVAYSAPEMLKTGGKNEVTRANRKTDVFAFAVSAWEILTRKKPDTQPKLEDLPHETPPSIREMIRECWSIERSKRWSALECFQLLNSVYTQFEHKEFDIFFSHRWASKHFLSHLYNLLCDQGFRVWYDINEMGHDLGYSMKAGVENSVVVLACIDSLYQNSPNCMLELRHAHKCTTTENGFHRTKAILAVMMEDGIGWGRNWGTDEVKNIVDIKGKMFINLHALAKENWDAEEGPSEDMKARLRKETTELFRILRDLGCYPSDIQRRRSRVP